jgi:hypothetical protein
MNYWQFKFKEENWNYWQDMGVGENESWRSPKTRNNKENDIAIGDIVFLYRVDKKRDRGIYFVTKVSNVDFNDPKENPIELEIIIDLKHNIFKPELFGFLDVMQKINKLDQRSTSYYKFEPEDNPQKLYDLIMNNEYKEFLPEEINQNESEALIEGAKKQIIVNAYERNSKARLKCINKHGYICAVCDFDFEKTYGDIGKNFIHIHHLREISSVAENYEVDPEKDLIPVCPNCHAMLHKQKPAYTINEMKKILNK